MQKIIVAALVIGGVCGAASLGAQGAGERVTVPFSDPSRPGNLNVQLMDGSMTVRGTDRRDVLIEATGGQQERESRNDQAASGLRRLTQRGGFSVDEQANTMRLSSSSSHGAVFTIEVPRRTNLKLNVVNGDSITVDGVEGDIETSNVNGPSTTLTNISGSVVAHATNGKILATITRVAAQKAMAFSALNGDVDVTLPASVKANVKLRSDQGDVFTGFEIQMTAAKEAPVVKDTRQSNGRYRIEVDRSLYGTINGGGPEFELRSFNGNVYLRRGK
jgi:DUF4097 and DUF4098 domain-containing protein YvlB